MTIRHRGTIRGTGYVAVVAVVMLVCALGARSQPYLATVIATFAVYAIVATGLDFVVGWLRQISVAPAAAMAVGAYAGQELVADHAFLAFVAAGGAGLLAGLVIGLPALRVSGFALAVYTLVLVLAVELVLGSVPYFGGTAGRAVVAGSLLGLDLADPEHLLLICLGLLALAILTYQLLRGSVVGISWRAVGQNARMATSLAVDPVRVRLRAFALSGLFAGVGGLLFAIVGGYLSPDQFTFGLSVQMLAMVVIGGRGHPLGASVGAALIVVYQQVLPTTNYNDIVIGLVLLLAAWFAPRGLAPVLQDVVLRGLRAMSAIAGRRRGADHVDLAGGGSR
ncbi:branched-chain amino acid ABC transporter permease [Pseudonocardia ailaonensis]|uniref:Branched-chain amino acid ABC transporter permease n=1 Tax=Pseudonocardia ailaonensis TaxID=367279 RepID=A0ABN2N4R0_9PSEU